MTKFRSMIAAALVMTSQVLGQNVDLATTGNFNIRFDGGSGSKIGTSLAHGDINGDGINDLIVGAMNAAHRGRGSSGSVYVIFGAAGNGPGTTVDLLQSTSYNIRYDGASMGESFGWAVASGDINGDGFDDVIAATKDAHRNGRSYAGSVYVMYGSAGSETGDSVDLFVATSYNVRFDGPMSSANLGSSVSSGDMNGDGYDDIIAGAYGTSFNTRFSAGSVYVMYGAAGTSTGNIRDLATSSLYHLRFDGAASDDALGSSVVSGDINGDGFADLIAGAYYASSLSEYYDHGSVYVVYGGAGTSTGNNRDLATAGNYNLRFDGGLSGTNYLGSSVASGDVNGDGLDDIVAGANGSANNGYGYSGSVYVIYGVADTSHGNNRDLATSSTFNLRFDGESGNWLGTSVGSGDTNGDGYFDLILGADQAANNSRSTSGTVFIIYGAAGSGTGEIRDLGTSSNYVMRFDGAASGNKLGTSVGSADLSGDGFADVVAGAFMAEFNSRVGSGSVYRISPVTAGTLAPKVRPSPAGDAPPVSFDTENVDLDLTAGTTGTVSVQLLTTQPSTNAPSHTASVSWKLSTTKTGITGTTVKLRFTDAQVAGLTKATLQMFKRPTGGGPNDWVLVDGSSVNTATNTVTGVVASFSEFTIGDASVLPVQMTNFSVANAGSGVELRWTTATEVDNAGWEVERREVSREYRVGSMEKDGWVKLGYVEGAGTSTSPREYTFSDQTPIPNTQSPITRFAFRLKQIDRSGSFSYSDEAEVEIGLAPKEFTLGQNYPNPFNPSTTIRFTLATDARTSLVVYDLLGREVARLVDGELKAGVEHHAQFDASRLSSGFYFARLESGGKRLIQTMQLVK